MDKPHLATRHLASINARWVPMAHTAAAAAAFGIAFIVTIFLHYKKSVRNELFAFPNEWFPTVSAATGERFPEKSFFQLFIAIAAGPRVLLVGIWYLLVRGKNSSNITRAYLALGIVRTAACGGFVYITNNDDHDWHDTAVITYGILAAGWMSATTYFTLNSNPQASKYRKWLLQLFLLTFVPLGHYYIQHRLYQKAGALSKYSLFEWVMVALDIGFDAVSVFEFSGLEIEIAGPPNCRQLATKRSNPHLV